MFESLLILNYSVFLLCLQFVKHGSLKDIQMDDVADFKLTDDAMTHMGISDADKLAIYTIIAGVLHLGNVSFEESHNDTTGSNSIMSFINAVVCSSSHFCFTFCSIPHCICVSDSFHDLTFLVGQGIQPEKILILAICKEGNSA